MNSNQEIWISQTSRLQAVAQAVAALCIGASLVWMTRELPGSGLSPERITFVLGVFIILGGLIRLLGSHEITTVDGRAQIITIERKSILGEHRRQLRFADIARLSVADNGKKASTSAHHFLLATLKSGQADTLFLGSYDETDSQERATETLIRLTRIIGK